MHDARPGGGQDRYALALVNGLARRHDVTLVACSADGLDRDVTFSPVRAPRRPLVWRASVFARRAARRLEGHKWDIIHTIGGAVASASVITAQYCHAAWLETQRAIPSSLVGPLSSTYREWEARAVMRQERRAVRSSACRALIGVSERVQREWIDGYEVQPSILAVIPNAVDLDRFGTVPSNTRQELRRRLGIDGNAFVLLTVGTLVRKGIETAIACLERLPDGTHLVAVGAGPHERVRAMAGGGGVAHRVHLVNPVPDVERYYHVADAFLFPTRYEPFGMVIAEAWAAGLPVVCAECAGALEWSTDRETALHVARADDAPGFAAAATRVMEDLMLRSRLIERGRDLAKSLSWDRVIAETEAVYESVVSHSRSHTT